MLTGADPSRSPAGPASSTGWTPAHLLAVASVAVGTLLATGPLRDVDAGWHVAVGCDILDGRRVPGAGSSWVAATVDPAVDAATWSSPQWLSETLMCTVQESLGWRGLVLLRVLGSLLLLVLVARRLFRLAPPRWPPACCSPSSASRRPSRSARSCSRCCCSSPWGPGGSARWTTADRPPCCSSASPRCCGPTCTGCGCCSRRCWSWLPWDGCSTTGRATRPPGGRRWPPPSPSSAACSPRSASRG